MVMDHKSSCYHSQRTVSSRESSNAEQFRLLIATRSSNKVDGEFKFWREKDQDGPLPLGIKLSVHSHLGIYTHSNWKSN